MPKKHQKDYIEKLINNTMQHGRKAAAIGLLVKTFSLFGQKLIRQKAPDFFVDLRRSRSRPKLLSVPLCKTALSKASPFPLGYNKEIRGFSNIEAGNFASESVISSRISIDLRNERRESIDLRNERRESIESERAALRLLTATAEIRRGVEGVSVAFPKYQSDKRPIRQYVKDAISNVKPTLETRKKKIAGITRHIPSVVPPSRGEGLAIRWLVTAARDKQRKTNKGFVECLSNEFLDAYLRRGEVRQKRDSLHKLAENNRSYIRYRWW